MFYQYERFSWPLLFCSCPLRGSGLLSRLRSRGRPFWLLWRRRGSWSSWCPLFPGMKKPAAVGAATPRQLDRLTSRNGPCPCKKISLEGSRHPAAFPCRVPASRVREKPCPGCCRNGGQYITSPGGCQSGFSPEGNIHCVPRLEKRKCVLYPDYFLGSPFRKWGLEGPVTSFLGPSPPTRGAGPPSFLRQIRPVDVEISTGTCFPGSRLHPGSLPIFCRSHQYPLLSDDYENKDVCPA